MVDIRNRLLFDSKAEGKVEDDIDDDEADSRHG